MLQDKIGGGWIKEQTNYMRDKQFEKCGEFITQIEKSRMIYNKYSGYKANAVVMNSRMMELLRHSSLTLVGFDSSYICGLEIIVDDMCPNDMAYVVQKVRWKNEQGTKR